MHTWTWTKQNGHSYLQCSLLGAWPHGFFTQQWWPQLPTDLVGAIAPNAQAFRVKQVHGNTVLTTGEWQQQHEAGRRDLSGSPESRDAPPLPEADGLIADRGGQAVWVATADCVPALIADEASGRVAAVHAGWRGTAQTIVPVTIQRLLDQGSRLTDLRVALGPAIAGDVYQVSTTVAAQVGATVVRAEASTATSFHDAHDANDAHDAETISHRDLDAILQPLRALERPPILDDPQPGRARLDVRRINELQLEHLGLSPDQVAIAPHCTYQEGDRFFSYRRTRQKKVQWSGIAQVS